MPDKNYTTRFVSPDPSPPRVEILPPLALPDAPISEPMPLSSHKDRAHGFVLATAPLAGVAGFVAALVGIIGWRVPIASLAALLLALGGFAFVWGCAFITHTFVSADGALLAHTLLAWQYLRREQKERMNRYGRK